MNRRDEELKQAIAVVNRGGTRSGAMARVARDLMDRATTSPRAGFIDGAVDLWQARRSADMTRIVADQSRDVVRVATAASDLLAIEKETEVRLSRLDLELDQVAYAQKLLQLRTLDVEQEMVIQQLTFGDRARAAMAEARVRAIHGAVKVTAAQGHLREAQQRAQLPPADYFDADPISDEFADFLDNPATSRRR